MPKKKGPALYELMRQQNSPKVTGELGNSAPEIDPSLSHNIIAPGMSYRFSIGTIGLLVAIGIALISISYTLGFNRGESIAKEDYASRILEDFKESDVSKIPTPKALEKSVEGLIKPDLGEEKQSWGLIQSDPREGGHYYFTLMQTNKTGALELAQFCREKGLETYAISGHNTRSYRVIALPGFIDRNGAIAVSLQTQIGVIGRQWAKFKASSTSFLQDAYPSLYNE